MYQHRQEIINDLKRAFHLFDADGNGYICREELKGIFLKVGESEMFNENDIDEILKTADTDGNGKICFDEFVMILTSDNK